MAVVSVIAHHEQMPLRNRHGIHVVSRIHVTRHNNITVKVSVRIRDFLAVQDNLLVANLYRIPSDSHYSLDEILGPIFREDEYNHISPSGLNDLRPSLVGKRNANAIKKLVYENVVPNEKGGFHGA